MVVPAVTGRMMRPPGRGDSRRGLDDRRSSGMHETDGGLGARPGGLAASDSGGEASPGGVGSATRVEAAESRLQR